MTQLLLITKLYVPPPNANIVTRGNLIARLDNGLRLGHTLILVSAPAGFGKSTIVADWLARLRVVDAGVQCAWLSLEPGDNDPQRFWRYVVAALQTADPALGRVAAEMLATPQPPPLDVVVTTVVNELAARRQRLILVLDDYHAIQSAAIHESVNLFLDHLPPLSHLVITTREDPPLTLSRRRARQQVVEVRAADLRFTNDEARQLFNDRLRLHLADADIDTLEARTEGWIVGLQMAAMSLQGQSDARTFITSFAGNDHYIADYLIEEVLQRQPAQVQDFLLRTSILERMTGPLCDALLAVNVPGLTDRSDALPSHGALSQPLLQQLEHANLFVVPLDNRQEWYRYHHLFAELLRQRLQQTTGYHGAAALHRQAAGWFADRTLYAEAIDHLLAAGDVAQVAELLERHVYTFFGRGDLAALVAWVQKIPWELVSPRLRLCLGYSWAALATGYPQHTERGVAAVEQQVSATLGIANAGLDSPSLTPILRSALLEAKVLKAQTALNKLDFDAIVSLSHEVLPYLADTDAPFMFNRPPALRSVALFNLGLARDAQGDLDAASDAFAASAVACLEIKNRDLYPLSIGHLAHAQMARGQLHTAESTYHRALQTLPGDPSPLPHSPFHGLLEIGLGLLSYEWNNLAAAQSHFAAGIERARTWLPWEVLLPGFIGLARLKRAQGQWDEAFAVLDEVTRLCRNTQPLVQPAVDACRAELWIAQGNLDAATRWAQTAGLTTEASVPVYREGQALVLVRLMSAQGWHDAADSLLARLLASAESGQRWTLVINILVLQALNASRAGRHDQALAPLHRALDLAAPEGYVRTFLDEGEPLRQLLKRLEDRDWRLSQYRDMLLNAYGTAAITVPTQSPITNLKSTLLEPLTERELEVLRLIAEGLTNQQIAQRLSISVTTVKTHTNNINGKLGAGSRTQALARARGLGLLSN